MNQGFNLSERNLPPENTALSDLSLSHQDMIFVDLPTRVSALALRFLSPLCYCFECFLDVRLCPRLYAM